MSSLARSLATSVCGPYRGAGAKVVVSTYSSIGNIGLGVVSKVGDV